MDRLRQADAALQAVASRSPAVLVPGRVTSPMDCCVTVPIDQALIDDCWARATGPGEEVTVEPGVVLDAEMQRLATGPPEPRGRRHTA